MEGGVDVLVKCTSVGDGASDSGPGRFAQVLTIETHYVVMAITFWGPRQLMLINPDRGVPAWFPLVLFDLVDGVIPRSWISGVSSDYEAGAAAPSARVTFGYEAVVSNPDHYRDLVDGVALARRIFEEELRNRAVVEEARFKLNAIASGDLTRTEVAEWAREWLETEGRSGFAYPDVIWDVLSDIVGLDIEGGEAIHGDVRTLIRALS